MKNFSLYITLFLLLFSCGNLSEEGKKKFHKQMIENPNSSDSGDGGY